MSWKEIAAHVTDNQYFFIISGFAYSNHCLFGPVGGGAERRKYGNGR